MHIRHQNKFQEQRRQSNLDEAAWMSKDSDTSASLVRNAHVDEAMEIHTVSEGSEMDVDGDSYFESESPSSPDDGTQPASGLEASEIQRALKERRNHFRLLLRQERAMHLALRPRPLHLVLSPCPGSEHVDPDLVQDLKDFMVSNAARWPVIPRPLSTPRPHRSPAQINPLFPRGHFQKELYKIHNILQRLVLPTPFCVVEPHDFLETLSWRHLEAEEKNKLTIVLRLRGQLRSGQLLLPFFWNDRVLLGLIDSGRKRLHVFNPGPVLNEADMDADGESLNHPTTLLRVFFDTIWPGENIYLRPDRPIIRATAARCKPMDPRIMET